MEAPLNDDFLFQLEKAAKQFKKRKNALLKAAGINITSDQWVLLKNILEFEGISQIDLADRCYKEPASVTRILDILEKKGWVERKRRSGNRREYNLYATPRGLQLIAAVLPVANEITALGSKELSKVEIQNLANMLSKIYQNLQ